MLLASLLPVWSANESPRWLGDGGLSHDTEEIVRENNSSRAEPGAKSVHRPGTLGAYMVRRAARGRISTICLSSPHGTQAFLLRHAALVFAVRLRVGRYRNPTGVVL
jgi:hypothetical protein